MVRENGNLYKSCGICCAEKVDYIYALTIQQSVLCDSSFPGWSFLTILIIYLPNHPKSIGLSNSTT